MHIELNVCSCCVGKRFPSDHKTKGVRPSNSATFVTIKGKGIATSHLA